MPTGVRELGLASTGHHSWKWEVGHGPVGVAPRVSVSLSLKTRPGQVSPLCS